MTLLGRTTLLVATFATFFALGCSSEKPATAERGNGDDASTPVTIAPEIDGGPGTNVESWRCSTTVEQADGGDGPTICTCSKFVVPVDTAGSTPSCAPEPCCIADGPDDCDCFSASFPQAMDCDGLVDQTNALESAQGMAPQAKRVTTCPE